MAASDQNDIENNVHDEASEWYASRHAANLQQVEASLNELASGYSALENQWSQLDYRENEGHDTLDTRVLQSVWSERQRLQQQAAQISNAYATLQNERQRLEQHSDPSFDDLLNGSSQKAQLFLTAHRRELQDNPAALKRLLRADALYKASLGKPDTNQYFEILKTAADLGEPNADDFHELSDEMRASSNATKREGTGKVKVTPGQKAMAKSLANHSNGSLSEEDYINQIANPFSKAATVTVEPDELDFGHGNKGMEVSLDAEKPTRKTVDPAKYKPSQRSMTLTPAQVKFCEASGIDPIDYVKNSLKVKNGETTHQWYEQRLRSQGLA